MTLEKAYALAGVNEPLALHEAYCDLEQPLFIARTWDYDNPSQVHNQIKRELEEINLAELGEEERDWCREILWFWHHHAISCAAWKNDRSVACFHAEKALSYQEADHPNQITQLLFFIAHDRLEEAKSWAATITGDVEGPTAVDLITWYEQGLYFGPPK
ncbi:MAG: hypothetical protein AAB388_04485 [Patescibacteria group bacterium]